MNIFEEVFEGYDIEREPCSEQDFEGWESYWWPPSESLSRATERKCLREGECEQRRCRARRHDRGSESDPVIGSARRG